MRIYFNKKDGLDKVTFSLPILSSDKNILGELEIFEYHSGLNSDTKKVNNLECILIDSEYSKKFEFVENVDTTGLSIMKELYDEHEDKLVLPSSKTYKIVYSYPEPNTGYTIKETICVLYPNLYKEFGVNVLFGNASHGNEIR